MKIYYKRTAKVLVMVWIYFTSNPTPIAFVITQAEFDLLCKAMDGQLDIPITENDPCVRPVV